MRPAPARTDPADLEVADGVAEVAGGRLDPRAWLDACLARIAARDPAIHAWVHVVADRSRAGLSPRGGADLPLRGVPIGVKDVIDVAGMPTGCNSPIEAERIAHADAAAVRRLVAAGAVVVGKTVTTEYAFLTPGPTRNPFDLSRTPGGSSSGSAAAVADGHVSAALTTQTGGSTIRPAAYCGIVGYKPPFGTVPNDGLRLLAPSLDTIGVHTRSVGDAALVATVLEARPRSAGPTRPTRFAWVHLPPEKDARPEVVAMMAATVTALRTAGADVEELIVTALAPLDDAHRVIMSVEVARQFADIMRRDAVRLSLPLREFIERGMGQGGDALSRAHASVAEAHRALWPATAGGVVLICPAADGEAPVGLESTGSSVFNRPWSLLRYGALTVPAGLGPNGMPLGLQLVDPSPGADRLFPAAAFAERTLAPFVTGRFGRQP
jgi:Asp-tRNA(Asn)/Glu-tRNA(Gln) amidotransferase A subunit family amidase